MKREVENKFYPELYLDIANKYDRNQPNVRVTEFVDGTHAAIVFLLKNTQDDEIISKILKLFTTGGAKIEASWIYDEYDDKYRGEISLAGANDEMCLEIIKMSHDLEIYPLNEEEKAQAENYVRNTKDIFPKYISESVKGTHKAVIYILVNSRNGDIKRTILEIIEKFVKVGYTSEDIENKLYYNKVSYKELAPSIAKKIKEIARDIMQEKKKQEEIFKRFAKKQEKYYKEKLDTFKRR